MEDAGAVEFARQQEERQELLDHVQSERNDVSITVDRLIQEKGDLETLRRQLKVETIKPKRKSFKKRIRMQRRSCRTLLKMLDIEIEQFVLASHLYEMKYKVRGGHHE